MCPGKGKLDCLVWEFTKRKAQDSGRPAFEKVWPGINRPWFVIQLGTIKFLETWLSLTIGPFWHHLASFGSIWHLGVGMQGCTHVPATCKKVDAEEETDQNVDDTYSAQRLQPLPQRTPQVVPVCFKKQALFKKSHWLFSFVLVKGISVQRCSVTLNSTFPAKAYWRYHFNLGVADSRQHLPHFHSNRTQSSIAPTAAILSAGLCPSIVQKHITNVSCLRSLSLRKSTG